MSMRIGFEGGHSDMPMDTDVGLWVVEGGLLDAAGAEKTAWTHLAEAALAGDTTVVVDDATGWEVGDEVVITLTEPVTVDEHWLHHDRRTTASTGPGSPWVGSPSTRTSRSRCATASSIGPRC